jgi:prepilin-type N-terminal cleavage/methylation domain-containing protein
MVSAISIWLPCSLYRRGFSLIELLVSLAIVILLLGIVLLGIQADRRVAVPF